MNQQSGNRYNPRVILAFVQWIELPTDCRITFEHRYERLLKSLSDSERTDLENMQVAVCHAATDRLTDLHAEGLNANGFQKPTRIAARLADSILRPIQRN